MQTENYRPASSRAHVHSKHERPVWVKVPRTGRCRHGVSRARERRACSSGRCYHEASARKMNANLANRVIAAPDDDLMDARRDQFTDYRIASGIVWSDADDLARLPADGVLRVRGCFRD